MILYAGHIKVETIYNPLKVIQLYDLEGFYKLRHSMQQWGILDPVVCVSYKENPIVVHIGQQRLKLAKELDIKWVRTILFDWNKSPGSWVSFNGGTNLNTEESLIEIFSDRNALGCVFLKEILKSGDDIKH